METLRDATASRALDTASVYMRHVYQWMTAGLAVTGAAAWFTTDSPAMMQLVFGNGMAPVIVLAVAVFALPLILSGMIARLSAAAATGLFLLYSALMGVFLSSVLLIYTQSSVVTAFVSTAGMFLAMSVYGTVTKRDLTSLGSFLSMGLIGLLIAMVVNLFLQNTMMEMVISAVGVLIFTGLTAYDTQRIRAFGAGAPLHDDTAVRRGAVLGALTLYLDFINLFLMLLRLMGDRR